MSDVTGILRRMRRSYYSIRKAGLQDPRMQSQAQIALANEVRQLKAELEQARADLQRAQIGNQRLSGDVADLKERSRLSQKAVTPAVRTDTESIKPSDSTKPVSGASNRPAAEIVKDYLDGEVQRASTFGAAATRMTVNVGFGPQYFYGSLHHKDIRVLERIAMKNKSLAARDAIALSATNLTLAVDPVIKISRAAATGILDDNALSPYREWVPRSLLSLARIIADQRLLETDLADSSRIYSLAYKMWGVGRFDVRHRLIYSELLEELGNSEALADFTNKAKLETTHPTQVALYEANRSRANGVCDSEWLGALNDLYTEHGFAPIEATCESQDTLSGLSATVDIINDGPLVSVLMPTYNGSAHILAAAQSILQQSWANLELIIVDDHSEADHWEYIRDNLPHDERLSLHRLPANQGAYRARRHALEQAKGSFVTVHDDDDWSHPQKLATQVQNLIQNPDVIANMSQMVRIDQNSRFVRINDNPEFSQKNYSSMMIRRADVVRLGGWDDLNRAADAEFHDRIFAVTGKRVQPVDSPPLSFMRARTGSLTSGEINKGALDFGRQTYGLLYTHWHGQLKADKTAASHSDRVVDFDPAQRPFAVPRNFLSGQRRISTAKYDLIYCTDYRFPGGNSALSNAEITTARDSGLRVAIIQMDSPVLRAPRPMNSAIADTLRDSDIDVLTLEDSVETSLLIVRNPTILQYADNLRSNIVPDRTILIANTAPVSINGKDASYSISLSKFNATRLWGAPVDVVAESPQTRHLLESLSPECGVLPNHWPGFVPDDQIAQPKNVEMERLPVLGRHSRDHRLKWPDSAESILAAYSAPSVFKTQILGGADSIASKVDLNQHGCEVLPFGALAPANYLRGIDFWVYMHSQDLVESFGMAIIEAMASGCVVVLPPYMEELFGDGALYAKPDDIQSLVASLWADRDGYSEQSRKAISIVRAQYSATAYLRRLANARAGAWDIPVADRLRAGS